MDQQPPGRGARPRISRAFVEEHRRRRYAEAAAELLHEFGREGATVTNLVRLAGTARNSYYDVFGSAEDCIDYGVALAAEELFAPVRGQEGGGIWIREVATAVAGFYVAVAERPLQAEFLLIHSAICRSATGRSALPRAIDGLAALLGRGRAECLAEGRPAPPPLLDEYLAWAVAAPAAASVRTPEVADLPQKSAGVSALVGSYYLGPEATEKGLAGPA